MKKLSFLLPLILCSCSSARNNDNAYKKIYLNDFKIKYLEACLIHGYKDTKAIKKLIADDMNGFAEPILGDAYELIDSLALKSVRQIEKDSIDREGKVAEGGNGKKVLKHCLCYYNSKWLDSIAKANYKIYKKQDDDFYKMLRKNKQSKATKK